MTHHRITISSAALLAAAVAHAASSQPQYSIVDLTELANDIGVIQCEGRSVNAAGQVVGFESVSLAIERAILWDSDGTAQFLGVLPKDNSTIAADIADDGTVYGLSEFVELVKCGNLIKIFETQKATMWQDGTPIDINGLVIGGDTSFDLNLVRDHNDAGKLVGFGRDPKGPPPTPRGFLLEDGIVINLGILDSPMAINNLDKIVGFASPGNDKAYLWVDGELTNLHDHPSITGVTSLALGISDDGIIAGVIQFDIANPDEAGLWIDGEPIRLVPEINRPQGAATAINSHNQVVGWFNDLDNLQEGFRAFIWEDGERIELLDMIPPDEGWDTLFPFDINDQGQIVGGGIRNGQIGHGFLMTPVRVFDETPPDDFSAFRGFYVSGDLDSLPASDDDKLCYNPGIVLNPAEAPVTLDFFGTLPNDSPSTLDVTIESSANTVGLELTISFWNYNTNSWDVVGTATQSLNADTVRTFPGTPADHVELGTGAVRTRYEVRVVSFIFLFPWLDCVDHVFWTTSN